MIPATDDRISCIQEGPLGHHCRLILLVVEFGEVCSRPAVIPVDEFGFICHLTLVHADTASLASLALPGNWLSSPQFLLMPVGKVKRLPQ